MSNKKQNQKEMPKPKSPLIRELFPRSTTDKKKPTIIEGIEPEILAKIHKTVHSIRSFAAQYHFAGIITGTTEDYDAYEELANACRNSVAAVLKRDPNLLHCTLKYISEINDRPISEWKTWTFARSTIDSTRPRNLGPNHSYAIEDNSALSALAGCKDKAMNNWGPYAHRCFVCNDLVEEEQYANPRFDWQKWYACTMVFPIRYERWHKRERTYSDPLLGFLTFDALEPNMFAHIPSVFKYIGDPGVYFDELKQYDVYHVGDIVADTIATALLLERRIWRLKTIIKKEQVK